MMIMPLCTLLSLLIQRLWNVLLLEKHILALLIYALVGIFEAEA